MIYEALVTGCALAGPAGCAAASNGDSPDDIDVKFQALLKAAYDAKKVNASVPLTSGEIRGELSALAPRIMNGTDRFTQRNSVARCTRPRTGHTS